MRDQPLVMAPGKDDPLDYADIFRTEFAYVWNSLARLGVASRDLEDLTHDVFCHVYRKLSQYDPSRPLRPWLFVFAYRAASDYRKLARHRLELVGVDAEPDDPSPSAADALISAEERRLLEAALSKVPIERRAVLLLHEVDGFSVPEIAAALALPVNTVYSRLRIARGELVSAAKALLSNQETRPPRVGSIRAR